MLIRIIDLSSVHESINDKDFRIALCRLSSWGRVIYIDGLDHVILQPTFLTQRVLGELFRPEHKDFFQNGEISVTDLRIIWSDSCSDLEDLFDDMITNLKGLLVCFAKENDDEMLVFPDFLPEFEAELESLWPAMSHAIDLELAYGFDMDVLPQEMLGVLAAMLSGKVSHLVPWKNMAIMYSKKHQQTYARIHATKAEFPGIEGRPKVERQRLLIHVRGSKFGRQHAVDLLVLISDTVRRCLEGYPGIAYDEILQSCSKLEKWDDDDKPRAIYMNEDGTATVPCDDWLLRRDIERTQLDELAIFQGATPSKHTKGTLASPLEHLFI